MSRLSAILLSSVLFLALLLCPIGLLAQTPVLPESAIPSMSDTAIRVDGVGFTVAKLSTGEKAFENRNYTWQDVPARLQGWEYTRTSGGEHTELSVSADKDTTLYLATAADPSDAGLAGWTPDKDLTFSYSDKNKTVVTVFQRSYHPGATVRVSLSTWSGALLLGPHIDAVLPALRTKALEAIKAFDVDALTQILAQDPRILQEADQIPLGLLVESIRAPGPSGADPEKRQAITEKRQAMIAWLIDHGADVNAAAKKPAVTPLIAAIDEGALSTVTLLMAHGADPNLLDGNGDTPLHHIIVLERDPEGEVIPFGLRRDLLAALTAPTVKIPVDPKHTDSHGMTPLLEVASAPFATVPLVQILVDRGADLKARTGDMTADPWPGAFDSESGFQILRDDFGTAHLNSLTVLSLATIAGNEDLVRYFAGKGADFNTPAGYGDTTLHYAAVLRSPLLPTLLSLHAAPNAKNDAGETPLAAALAAGPAASRPATLAPLVAVSDLAVHDREGLTPLLEAIVRHDRPDADLIAVRKPPGDKLEKAEWATARDDVTVLKPLLTAQPALSSERLPNGWTLLHTAACWHSSQVAALLLRSGADANARDARGDTPLTLAFAGAGRRGQEAAGAATSDTALLDIVRVLIAGGGFVNAVGANDQILLTQAVARNSPELASLLLLHGAMVNAAGARSDPPLMAASTEEMVDLLLKAGADLNAQDSQGQTLLMHAAASGNINFVDLLLTRGAKVDVVSPSGESAATDARYSPRLLDLLVQHGASVPKSTPENSGRVGISFLDLLWSGDIEGVKKALLADPSLITRLGPNGQSPLATAVQSGRMSDPSQMELVQFLLDHGADVNARSVNGETPLFTATSPGTVALLLQKGAKPNVTDAAGDTPLHAAARRGDRASVDALLAAGARPDVRNTEGDLPLHAAFAQRTAVSPHLLAVSDLTARGHRGLTAVQFMLERGDPALRSAVMQSGPKLDAWTAFLADVAKDDPVSVKHALLLHPDFANMRLSDGATPLHIAAAWNASEAASALLASGADGNARNGSGETPLHWAIRREGSTLPASAVATLLLTHGADPNAVNDRGIAPLHLAVRSGDAALVRLLLAQKAAADLPSEAGDTPLHIVATRRDAAALDIVNALCDGGANVNVRSWSRDGLTGSGATPLECAASESNPKMIQLLIKRGADVNLANWQGVTPLLAAVRQGNSATVYALLDGGANVNAANSKGQTPLDWALVRQDKLADILVAHGGRKGTGGSMDY